jgi:hypothetical protein
MAFFKLLKGKAQPITPRLAAAKNVTSVNVQDVVEANLEENLRRSFRRP